METYDIRVSSWAELNELLYEGAWQEPLRRFRSPFAFRGLSRSGFELTTSLARLGGPVDQLEIHLLRSFRKYARREAVPADSIWNWLALAQHHGLPTRLLDWTYSPYTAMHFATEQPEHFDVDGIIWCVNFHRSNEFLPDRLKAVLAEEGPEVQVFTAEMLARVASSLQELDSLAEFEFVLFFEPPSLDDRIINQYAFFSLMSGPNTDQERWLVEQPEIYRRIVIPAELKWEVRDKLDQANITERVLYPGLDGLSRWLRRYYTPRR